ncbi:conserved Plasmodium protein, unknown function [Plasmodium chabaudi adami]|uniref:Reticulon domain-containing protein n=1 Tax=Plasmodium chabaudi adami TaxID=5826 RepID=A0A1C6YI73_PLACE|nr:conserved Plasmodium protein, unknown function [Plasmodium chabaudi adami]SCN61537.1 conserved Plasmodium protein, unknown function [Plasmodium chabaudi adami]
MTTVNSKIINLSIFFSINAFYMLLYIFNHTFIQVISTLCILLLLVSGLFVFLQVNTGADYKENEKLEIVSKKVLDSFITYLYELINDKLTQIRKYLLWKNKMENLTVIVIIYLIGNFFSFLNFSVLFYILTWGIFLYNHISNVYIKKIYAVAYPCYVDIKEQAKYVYENIPKLKHIKKNI